MPSGAVLQIKVTLADIRPPIWRRLQVPADITLDRLHRVIQTAMSWEGNHLHVFETPMGAFGRPDTELGHRDEREVSLRSVAPAVGDRIGYTYDFGDNWLHHIQTEKALNGVPGTAYPRCVTGRRACPPEDCGGPWGYGELLVAVADPEHEEHRLITEWLDGPFDPEYLDVDRANKLLTDG
ncbi:MULTISPECIES: plasmid pRiA4b ORF-3 family protein [Streptomyces]|uniref:plasmid pRiA4b ORF-3 family protein n=1 Tax=Streptomyces TaxID=1883 RepID=UPI0022492EF6|nr:plasmid pRiA4b ORF-3 family protein [Streptomyces sp. JHD 1]MCX2970493.1 plasmid pRiA4b ORF-3 family protein [Streptomyces sp. JHD 1]